MSSESFVAKVLRGDVLDPDLNDELDDAVEGWHRSDTTESLATWLGFTEEEYRLWVEKPSVLRFILHSRRSNIPLGELLRDDEPLRLAARGGTEEEMRRLRTWLKGTGRL
jgi:hypothetical protein